MSINEEKMFILKMLEQGKITSDEAAKLISALEGKQAEENAARQQKQNESGNQNGEFGHKANQWKRDWKNEWKGEWKRDWKKKDCNGQSDFDRIVDDFSAKAEKFGKNVASTTAGIFDKVVDFVGSFVDTNSFNIFGSYNAVDKNYEAQVAEGKDLYIEGVNGNIMVKKHLDDKVVIRTRIRCPQNDTDSIVSFSEDEGAISLKVANRIMNLSVSHEIFLPAVRFNNVKIETSNGKIYVEDALAKDFSCITKNSHIDLMGVNSEKVSVNTKNGKIQISYIISKEVEVNTSNSLIDIKNMKAETLKAITTNGRIAVENAQSYEGISEINLLLKTSNSGIKVNMNDMDSKGYKVRGKTTNGGINLLIPDLVYENISKLGGAGNSFIEAESKGYQDYPEKVYINAETQNGYIEIVK